MKIHAVFEVVIAQKTKPQQHEYNGHHRIYRKYLNSLGLHIYPSHPTPPPQNLISATDIKFSIGGPLAWSSNKEQMSRRNRKPSEDWSYFTVEVN